MFVRRIEMLKRTKTTASESLRGHARVGVIAVVAAIALVAIGIRGPQINAVQKATAEPLDEQPAVESVDQRGRRDRTSSPAVLP
jgi:hypothetical protein